jgi:manganese/zinc/iron transport system permease protein
MDAPAIGFNTLVVVVGTMLLGIAAGIVGVFALLRKRSLTADAMAHATLPGIGLAFIVATALGAQGRTLPVLLAGAVITGVVGMWCIHWLVRRTRVREDAAIAIVLSVFFGAGVVVLSVVQGMRTGNAAGVHAFIYGQTAAMRLGDAALLAGLALGSALVAGLVMKELTVVCFDDAFARVDGWPVGVLDGVMTALIVVVTVAGLQSVGLILVVAMVVIPAAAARFWTDRAGAMVVVAGALGGLSGLGGSIVSASMPRAPAGAVIVLVAGAVFLVSMVCAPRRGAGAMVVRRVRHEARLASEHVLEAAHAHHGGAMTRGALAEVARERGWPAWMPRIVAALLRARGEADRAGEGGLTLTERGRASGARVARNHRLWERYLIRHADIAPGHVDWTVDQVEHVLGADMVRELEDAIRDDPGAAK